MILRNLIFNLSKGNFHLANNNPMEKAWQMSFFFLTVAMMWLSQQYNIDMMWMAVTVFTRLPLLIHISAQVFFIKNPFGTASLSRSVTTTYPSFKSLHCNNYLLNSHLIIAFLDWISSLWKEVVLFHCFKPGPMQYLQILWKHSAQ